MSDKVVIAFLKDWLEWVDAGAPWPKRGCTYLKDKGLCGNLSRYCLATCVSSPPAHIALQEMLLSDGLDTVYPFGEYEYREAEYDREMHLDPNRIEWVRKTIAKYS